MALKSAYGATAVEIAELFADYLDGDAARPALALSSKPLGEAARDAIGKSLAAFGYPPDSCTYATVTPRETQAEGGDISLDPQALFALVEGLDPLFVIATDAEATRLLSLAFRTEYPVDAPIRAFGRPACAFADFTSMLGSEKGKQKAWAILKSLNA